MKKQTKEPVRILQIVTVMNRGGLETMLMNYYRNVDRNKIQFDFLVHRADEGDYDDEIIALGGKIFHFQPISLRNIGRYGADLKAFFRKHPEYQTVHTHLDSLSALPLSVAKAAGIPKRIAHSHTSSFDKNIKYVIRNVTKRFIKYFATDYMGCSRDAIKFMFGSNIKHFNIINNAINVDEFSFEINRREAMRAKLGVQGKFVVGHVGRFSYPKNHEFLIKVFKRIYNKNDDAVLMLVGHGENEIKIRQRVADLQLQERVIFLGLRSDIPDLMQAMDVFVMPSRYEGLPVVSIEAQASGLHCFFSNVITRDLSVTSNCHYLDLKDAENMWAQEILNIRNTPRQNMSKDIKKFGYDINSQSKKLVGIYLSKDDRLI